MIRDPSKVIQYELSNGGEDINTIINWIQKVCIDFFGSFKSSSRHKILLRKQDINEGRERKCFKKTVSICSACHFEHDEKQAKIQHYFHFQVGVSQAPK